MVKKRGYSRVRRGNSRPLEVGQGLTYLLTRMGGSPGRAKLSSLWANWHEVLGPELGAMALPIGCHKDTLLLGGRDGLEIMELRLRSQEILDRVNAFLQCEHFSKTRISLVGSKKSLNLVLPRSPQPERKSLAVRCKSVSAGRFLSDMDMSSPVARCYARFAKAGAKN